MKKLFSFLLIAIFATSMAFAWDGDGFLANPVRVWSDPAIYDYDQEITWYYDMSGAEDSQLDGTRFAIWVWQPSAPTENGLYGNEDGATIADVNPKLILKDEGDKVYSLTLTPTEFFGKTKEEIIANGESGYWQHLRLFDANGICVTNCGSFPILFPHQILAGTRQEGNDGIAEYGAVWDLVEFAVYPTIINATTPIAFILNNDELGASWDGSLHFVSGLNGWQHKVDYAWPSDENPNAPDLSKCSNYCGFDDIYVFNVSNPSEYYGVDYNYVIDDIQFLFTPFAWASAVVLENEWEFEQATPWKPTTGINKVITSSNELKASVVDGILTVNAPSITLYNVSGACIAKSNTSTLNILDLPKGVYIVKTALGSVKVVK